MIPEAEKKRVADAIRAVEAKTSGEIYCVIAQHASDYRLVPIAWGAALALLVPLPLMYVSGWSPEAIYACQLGTFVLSAAVLSLPVAALIFRLRGHYFAIGTWIVAEVFRLLASQVSVLGGGSGTSLPVDVVTSIAGSRQMR